MIFFVQLADAREVEEREARLASEHAARLKTFALFHVVSEAHQACAPVPQADEKQSGTSIDALPLAHAFRCALRLSDTPDALYNAVQVRLCTDFLVGILNYVEPHMQTALSLPRGSFLLWSARQRDESNPGLRPAMLWPHDDTPPADADDGSEPLVQARPGFVSLVLYSATHFCAYRLPDCFVIRDVVTLSSHYPLHNRGWKARLAREPADQ